MSPQLLPKHPSFCLLSLLHATGLSRPLFHTRMEPNTCAACNAPFRGGDAVISVLGRRYHSACFACDFCHQPLANGPCPPQHPMLLPQSPHNSVHPHRDLHGALWATAVPHVLPAPLWPVLRLLQRARRGRVRRAASRALLPPTALCVPPLWCVSLVWLCPARQRVPLPRLRRPALMCSPPWGAATTAK